MAFFSDEVSINSIIGPGSIIKGDLKINGFMRIDGDLDGNIETTGKVIVGATARVNGNITAKSITIVGGVVKGNIIAPESVTLLSSSAVIGDIQTRRFKADDDIILHGHCIALSDEAAYNEAQESWQDRQAIANKSIFTNIHSIREPEETPFSSETPKVSGEQTQNTTDQSQPQKPRGLFGGIKRK